MALQWSAMVQQLETLHRIARVVMRARPAGDADEPELLDDLRQVNALPGSHLAQVSAIGPDGYLIRSTLPTPPGRLDLSGREHLLAIARDGKDRFIGRPVRGAVSGKVTIRFSEAMRNSAGTLLADGRQGARQTGVACKASRPPTAAPAKQCVFLDTSSA